MPAAAVRAAVVPEVPGVPGVPGVPWVQGHIQRERLKKGALKK